MSGGTYQAPQDLPSLKAFLQQDNNNIHTTAFQHLLMNEFKYEQTIDERRLRNKQHQKQRAKRKELNGPTPTYPQSKTKKTTTKKFT